MVKHEDGSFPSYFYILLFCLMAVFQSTNYAMVVQYSTVHYITVQYSKLYYCTVQYSTIISAGSVLDVIRQQDQGSH